MIVIDGENTVTEPSVLFFAGQKLLCGGLGDRRTSESSAAEPHLLLPFLPSHHPPFAFLSPPSFGPSLSQRQDQSFAIPTASMVSQLWAAADAGDAAQVQLILANSDSPVDIEIRGA